MVNEVLVFVGKIVVDLVDNFDSVWSEAVGIENRRIDILKETVKQALVVEAENENGYEKNETEPIDETTKLVSEDHIF